MTAWKAWHTNTATQCINCGTPYIKRPVCIGAKQAAHAANWLPDFSSNALPPGFLYN